MISIEDFLVKFKSINNVEYNGKKFLTNLKSIGPGAYLNIIYMTAESDIQQNIIEPLSLPYELREFYEIYNGADLFSDLLSIYGFLPKFYLIDRTDWRETFPYDFLEANNEFYNNINSSNIVIFGSYGFDRSRVFIDKNTNRVYCSNKDNLNKIRATWPSFNDWIKDEIDRFSNYFDEYGNRLVNYEETLPGEK